MSCTNTDSIFSLPSGTETHCHTLLKAAALSPVQLLNPLITHLLPTHRWKLKSRKPVVNIVGRQANDLIELTDTV